MNLLLTRTKNVCAQCATARHRAYLEHWKRDVIFVTDTSDPIYCGLTVDQFECTYRRMNSICGLAAISVSLGEGAAMAVFSSPVSDRAPEKHVRKSCCRIILPRALRASQRSHHLRSTSLTGWVLLNCTAPKVRERWQSRRMRRFAIPSPSPHSLFAASGSEPCAPWE